MIWALLLSRVRWILVGAVAGGMLGALAGRAVTPIYEAAVTLTFDSRVETPTQAAVVSESVGAVLRDPDLLADLAETSGVAIRRIIVRPADAHTATVVLQGYGEAADVQRVARLAVDRALAVADSGLETARESFSARAPDAMAQGWRALLPLGEAMFRVGLGRGRQQGRVDQQVAGRLPAPMIKAVRPWYETGAHATGEAPPVRLQPRFVLAGVLDGIGVAILLIVSKVTLARLRDDDETGSQAPLKSPSA